MRTRRLQLLAALAVLLAFVACTLNPQPLPPLDPENAASADAGSFGTTRDSGTRTDDEEPSAVSDAGASPPDGGAGDAGDAGDDAGDGGDAGDDAGDGGDVSDPG